MTQTNLSLRIRLVDEANNACPSLVSLMGETGLTLEAFEALRAEFGIVADEPGAYLVDLYDVGDLIDTFEVSAQMLDRLCRHLDLDVSYSLSTYRQSFASASTPAHARIAP